MTFDRRHFIQSAGATLLLGCGDRAWATQQALRPEDFGARGDGRTNDTAAFVAMAARINALGGGVVELSRKTYLVGQQSRATHPGTEWAFAPSPVIALSDCRLPVTLRGNGARLRCAPTLRFGTFDAATGNKTRNAMPFYGYAQRASPYGAMISIARAQSAVTIEDLELDGNAEALSIGGPWGDTGWQIPGSGIYLNDNRGDEILRGVFSHHHPTDGLIIDGLPPGTAPGASRLIANVRTMDNGRQGVSLVGGAEYVFQDCEFGRSARGLIKSSPGAGFDIEAEGGKTVRSVAFVRCKFFDNSGCGLVCDSGDSADLSFKDCRFVGTTSWSAWPKKPGVTFERCLFVGALSNVYGGPDLKRAARFLGCDFKDDPALSGGRVYLGGGAIADLSTENNMLFDHCRFRLTHAARLPWSTGAIYADCEMSQSSSTMSYPRGTYRGRTIITGQATLSGSINRGEILLNGRRLPPGQI